MPKRKNEKPDFCTYPDCFVCPYNDCIADGIFPGETKNNAKYIGIIKTRKNNRKEECYE